MNKDMEWLHRGYGKNHVKLLHLRREGPVHTIKEYEVNTALTLDSDKDYIVGDNSDIIATDSQKNTVYILAKNHGVKSPEDFALLLCSHFLTKYSHVTSVKVDVEEYPWRRLVTEGRLHNHAFLFSPEVLHTCSVTQARGGESLAFVRALGCCCESPRQLVCESLAVIMREAVRHSEANHPHCLLERVGSPLSVASCASAGHPQVSTGLEGMRVLKTTQSSFTNFVSDEFRSLPDMEDRLFSTVVSASWQYADVTDIDFGRVWIRIQKIIYDKFAGPPDCGIYSPSVQNTVFLIQDAALKEIAEITQIKVTMPNKHYYGVDLSQFPEVGCPKNEDVFLPIDKPSGNISGTLGRKLSSKL
ncbi:uricase-like [Penaeus japonicus]|uniref:uricase-like n=1 Tax=Penaeus japonicus TaxID=27405 RepID=UPI001C712A7E|nr:uricase-like [Penaeus japonicus]